MSLAASLTRSAAALLLLPSTLLAQAPSTDPAALRTALEQALDRAGTELENGYGYCGSRSTGDPQVLPLFNDDGTLTYLLVQPLACGDRVAALAASDEGAPEIHLVTREDFEGFLARLVGAPPPASREEPEEPAPVVPAVIGSSPISDEEQLIDRSRNMMEANDAVQAKRVRDDITYHTPPHAATLYYVSRDGLVKHYVLVSELLGSVKSGKPYVDIYLRGYGAENGMVMEDGSPRAEMIKSKPWKHLEDLPRAPRAARKPPPRKPKEKRQVLELTADQEEACRLTALQGIQEAIPATRDTLVSRQLSIVGITGPERGRCHAYVLVESPESTPERVTLIAARVSMSDTGGSMSPREVKTTYPWNLQAGLAGLRESEPEEGDEDSGPDDTPEAAPEREFSIPRGGTEDAEAQMRSVAVEMFNADAGLQSVLSDVAQLGGKTGKAHAVTVGRQDVPGRPTDGSYYILVTRTVPALDRRRERILETFETYGRVYRFYFNGDPPEELAARAMGKLMGMVNIE